MSDWTADKDDDGITWWSPDTASQIVVCPVKRWYVLRKDGTHVRVAQGESVLMSRGDVIVIRALMDEST